jgi:hypothetical protein
MRDSRCARWVVFAACFLLLAACGTGCCSSRWQKAAEEYARPTSEPTPAQWRVGSTWNFKQFARNGSTVLDVTFRLTDKPVETCSSGDWRELELIEGQPHGQLGGGRFETVKAYSVTGRLLLLDFTGWCDLGGIRGVLSGASFLGDTTGGPFTHGQFDPERVVGVYVEVQ